ncbi:MAG: hypothetical protein VKO65_02870 [Cyanobacteriota bacterium]|nr:hypothetical protein [Cyanobacteriota bacterium]
MTSRRADIPPAFWPSLPPASADGDVSEAEVATLGPSGPSEAAAGG